MANKIYLSCIVMLFMASVIAQQPSSFPVPDSIKLIQTGAILVRVSNQFAFTEGPAVDKQGNIFFTDQPNDKIWKYDTAGKLSVFLDKTYRANGMYFSNDKLVVCADEKDQLLMIDKNKNIQVLLSNFHGHLLNGPNDCWVDKQGGIYFTDPYYQRDYWQRKKPDLEKQNVYFLHKGSHEAIIADSNLLQPNGIVGTPDGKHLYVADIRGNKTYKYDIGRKGMLMNRRLFVQQGSDGMTLDEQGNLYISGKGVTIYNSAGKMVGIIAVPSAWVGNLCFGGKDKTMLFITASESIYTLQMMVKGVE